MTKLLGDPRIDPRIKKAFGDFSQLPASDVSSRDELVEQMRTPEAMAMIETERAFFRTTASDAIAPRDGLSITTRTFTSSPDGNTVNILFIRPEGDEVLPCVYYTHGGGMAYLSAFDDNYQAWGRIMASKGVAVALVDFRNALLPSTAPEVAPFPAGLDDCVSGLKWVHAHADELGIDTERLIIAGDSGGGNLAIATALSLVRSGEIGLLKGIYALCPFIAGRWPMDEHPSSHQNEGIFIAVAHNRIAHAYGINELQGSNPLAWPLFAQAQDVKGFPATVVSVNECDPLCDEGIAFYRFLLDAGVPARCRMLVGTVHATEVFPGCAPDISHNTANDIAYLANTTAQWT